MERLTWQHTDALSYPRSKSTEAEVVGRSVWAISEVTHPRACGVLGVRQLIEGRALPAAKRGKLLWLILT